MLLEIVRRDEEKYGSSYGFDGKWIEHGFLAKELGNLGPSRKYIVNCFNNFINHKFMMLSSGLSKLDSGGKY